jgi:asparagine synthase (glutamine-hydrolysing)
MSGFFGVFSPGGNVDRLAIDQMQTAIQRDGYDELETHIDDHIAMGHLMLRVTPESAYDKQPLKSNCGRYILVGHFRLDYRDELGDKLGFTQKELDLTPDSLLVMNSYQKWGDKCVHHLEGDWTFVLYDRVQNIMTCFKDKYGTSAFFYAIYGERFILRQPLISLHLFLSIFRMLIYTNCFVLVFLD